MRRYFPFKCGFLCLDQRKLYSYRIFNNEIFFSIDPFKRHTLWTLIIGGTGLVLSIFGANQTQIQRYMACRDLKTARRYVIFSVVLSFIVFINIPYCSYCRIQAWVKEEGWAWSRKPRSMENNHSEKNDIYQFYEMLQSIVTKCSGKHMPILMRYLYSKVRTDITWYEDVMGQHGLGEKTRMVTDSQIYVHSIKLIQAAQFSPTNAYTEK
ncbi:unnamed protein product [Schistosoma margrebowiei]|uniref:Uncharacterized protein n=1 Tax=Schistosoma margrebowiei TaxID=48269 RepID=A0A3P7ZSA0_9TREM|nr:unnamed protein product [Schistosoma margrebowiei]